MTSTMNTEIFHPAFFGYENLPDLIELDNRKLIPIKAIRLKYQGKSQSKGAFCAENIRSLCNILGIELYRPVRGLYCIEEHYSKFFDYLHQFYSQHFSFSHHNFHHYENNGDLIWSIYNWKTGNVRQEKKCDGKLIKTLFNNFI
jgi:hypothetical protein